MQPLKGHKQTSIIPCTNRSRPTKLTRRTLIRYLTDLDTYLSQGIKVRSNAMN